MYWSTMESGCAVCFQGCASNTNGRGNQALVVCMDPLYRLFDKNGVISLFQSKLGSTNRFEARFLFDLLNIYYDNDKPDEAIASYLNSVPRNRLHKALAYLKKNRLAETISGRNTVITADLLKNSMSSVEYAPFPRELQRIIEYYRDVSPHELLYLVDWVRDAGIPENLALEYINRLLSLDSQMSLDELTHCMTEMNHNPKDDTEEIYKTAFVVMRALAIDNNPGKREQNYIRKWKSLGFSEEDILLACDNALDSPTFHYVDAIIINARSAMDKTGIKPYKELIRFTREYKEITGASGVKDLNVSSFIRFAELRTEYSDEEIRLAADFVINNYHSKILKNNRLIYIQRVLKGWRDRGLHDISSIRSYLDDLEHANALMGSITVVAELDVPDHQRKAYIGSIIKWLKAGCEDEDIIDAATAAAIAEAKNPLAYMHKIMNIVMKYG